MGAAYAKVFTQVLWVQIVTIVISVDNSLDNELLGLGKNDFYVLDACHAVLSDPCSLVATCWERADLCAPFYMMFSCVFLGSSCVVFNCIRFLIFAFILTLVLESQVFENMFQVRE